MGEQGEVLRRGGDRLRQMSKLLFGNRVRLEAAVRVATAQEGKIFAGGLAEALDAPISRAAAELWNFEQAGLVRRLPRIPGERRVIYQRRPSPFWSLAVEMYEEIAGDRAELPYDGQDRTDAAIGTRQGPSSRGLALDAVLQTSEGHVLVEAKTTDWDSIKSSNRQRNLRRHADQLWRSAETTPGSPTSLIVQYPNEPRDPRIADEIEQRMNNEGIAVVWGADDQESRVAKEDGSVPAPEVNAYCVRERRKVIMANPREVILRNGRHAVSGRCPNCSTKLFKIGRLG